MANGDYLSNVLKLSRGTSLSQSYTAHFLATAGTHPPASIIDKSSMKKTDLNASCVSGARTVSESSSVSSQLLHTSIMDDEFTATDLPLSTSVGSFQGQRSWSESKLYTENQPTALPASDKSTNNSRISKQESLKARKKHYRNQKKKATKELLSTLKDPSIIVMEDWLKVRGTLKGWTKYWCILKPGLLIIYKSQKHKSGHRIGTVLLNTCELIERPSKKDGFCFKLFHPLDQSIWAARGTSDSIGAITQPLPYSYLICRAQSEEAGTCWMDALELALRCSSLLLRSMTKERDATSTPQVSAASELESSFVDDERAILNDSDCERHFQDHDLTDDYLKPDRETKSVSESEMSASEEEEPIFVADDSYVETMYTKEDTEELGQQGDECQTEEVDDESKSLIWTLVKQVRPGMDLSRVVLPTFILEPRSFLDKLTDYYYHADLLSEAVLHEDAFTRMKSVVRWYLSGFYKKPKGLKKPYNPVIGEVFRCYWLHPKTNSRTFYIAEQISHHPPVSAFHVSNRQDGFTISASILTKSRFYGNSISAILDGTAKMTFLKRGEDYFITMPYAYCKGILIGTLTMEMGGKVRIDCPKTGYHADMEFKLKPFLGSEGASNRIVGKIRMGSDTLATIEGHWDEETYIKDKRSGDIEMFWNPTPEMKGKRLKRYVVPISEQGELESQRLWSLVSEAVTKNDMHSATHEKFVIEEKQRVEAKERKIKMVDWVPQLFELDHITGEWVYKYTDSRPWDASVDLAQFEHQYRIQTHTKHRTPVVRTRSITSLEQQAEASRVYPSSAGLRMKRPSKKRMASLDEESGSSEVEHRHESDSSESARVKLSGSVSSSPYVQETILEATSIDPIREMHKETQTALKDIEQQLFQLRYRFDERRPDISLIHVLALVTAAFIVNTAIQFFLR